MQKSNVFIFYDYFFPAFKAGGPIQSIANLADNFSDSISYKIICSRKDVDGTISKVETDKWVSYNQTTEVFYSSGNKRSSSFIKQQVNFFKPDILFINGLYSWKYNLIPLLFYKAKRKIISARGMLHPGALSQKSSKKKIYLFFFKLLCIQKKYEFHASNEAEKKFIQNTFGSKAKIHIAYNFPRIFEQQPIFEKTRGHLHLVSIALLSPMKNHLLVLQSLQKCPAEIIYDIYGAIKDKDYWRKCMELIKILPTNISINYKGDIEPSKVEEALKMSHVFILPSKSENFGHAIYEALSAGRPVITSKNTPWNNLQINLAGFNVSVNAADEIVSAINHFANMNNIEIENWSNAAKVYSQNAIDVSEIKEQYRKMFL